MQNIKSRIVAYSFMAIFLLVTTMQLKAQRAEFGIRFMPTFSNVEVNTASGGRVTGEGKLGFGIGALLGFNFNNHVGVQAEVIYSALAQQYKEEDRKRDIKLKYVNIPLMLSLNTGKTKIVNLNIVGGPQLGINVGSSIKYSGGTGSDSTNAVFAVKKGDFGFAYGVGLDFGINESRSARLSIGYRGVIGIADISDDSNTIDNNSYFVLDKSHVKTNAAYIGLSILF